MRRAGLAAFLVSVLILAAASTCGHGVKSLQAVEKLALSLINQWFSSHPSARIQ
ncbi:MAG: hypothetical protein ABSG90_14835 [Dehalococcoidia bacterium]|jgi:hypothetical protein